MSDSRQPLTVQEAMEALGVSDKTIRRLLKRGELEQHSTLHGRILITGESVERVRTHTPRQPEEPEEPEQGNSYAMVLASHYEALQHAHGVLAETVRDQAAYIRELQQQLADAQRQPRLTEEERASLVTEITAKIDRAKVDSPGSSLRTESKPEGSTIKRLLSLFKKSP